MRRIWLFNPDNDLALAAGTDNYTAPPAAARLRRSGAVLPMWMGAPGDVFLCDGVNDAWLSAMQADFGLDVNPWDRRSPGLPCPWGWSRAARRSFERAGVPPQALPPDDMLDRYRALSHRRTAIEVHTRLAAMLDFDVWAPGREVTDAAALADMLDSRPQSVVKLPWSSSGRGISFVDPRTRDAVLRQARGAIGRYGSVIVEPRAAKEADFAMLYTLGPEGAVFQGLSLFSADDRGHYTGNFVGPQHDIAAALGAVYPLERLSRVAECLGRALSGVLGGKYVGPVGVDMLIARPDGGGEAVLHPVVEVNLRYTMGFVALALARFVGGSATFAVEQGDTTASCRPVIEAGKLTAGRLALNPPGSDFTFVLSI